MNHVGAATRVLPELDIEAACDAEPATRPPGDVLQQWFDVEGRLVASGGRGVETWWMHWPGLGTYTFGRSGPVRARAARPGVHERLADSFTRGVAPVVMLARGCEALHASAVADARGVIAFCAASGTGKSTIALAVSSTGLSHWADDTVVYHVADGLPAALRLPSPVRVDEAALRTLGEPAVQADTPTERPLRRIYVLVRDPAIDPLRPSFATVPPIARFDRLLAHAHPFDLDGEPRRRRFVESLLALAARVDVCECRFGPSLDALAVLAAAIRAHVDTA